MEKVHSGKVLRSQFVTSKLSNAQIANKIMVIRDVQVIIDRDIAELYEIDTKVLKQSVKRNIDRFPESFCFELDRDEFADWRSQFVTSKSDQKGLRYAPFAFTEQGVAMLSAVLRSERAIKVSIEIMNAFVQMRHYLRGNIAIANRLDAVENRFNARFVEHDIKFEKIDENFSKIFNQLDASPQRAKEGVFFKGQIFDAYAFFQGIIRTATKEIVIIDGYVDLSVLERLAVKKKNVAIKIFTNPKAELQKIDVEQFNAQYPTAVMDYTKKMHDRFLIIDNKELYHIGASLKDLGKACFAFEKMEDAKTLIPAILAAL